MTGELQYAQHDAMRMEEEDGSPESSRIAGIEDGQRAFFRTSHLSSNGWPLSTACNATALGEGREVRIPRRRTRFPPPRSRWKGVSIGSYVPNSKTMDVACFSQVFS